MDLKLWNAPFKTNEEGLRMLNYSFDYIGGNSIVFYTVLPALKHAFSTCEFIFISSVFYCENQNTMNNVIKILCLFSRN